MIYTLWIQCLLDWSVKQNLFFPAGALKVPLVNLGILDAHQFQISGCNTWPVLVHYVCETRLAVFIDNYTYRLSIARCHKFCFSRINFKFHFSMIPFTMTKSSFHRNLLKTEIIGIVVYLISFECSSQKSASASIKLLEREGL
jgi:hypothetical protein